MRFTRHLVTGLAALLTATPVLAKDLYIYPAGGQSNEQMDKDKYECYNWAKTDSGFDPMAAQTASSHRAQRTKEVRWCRQGCPGRRGDGRHHR